MGVLGACPLFPRNPRVTAATRLRRPRAAIFSLAACSSNNGKQDFSSPRLMAPAVVVPSARVTFTSQRSIIVISVIQ